MWVWGGGSGGSGGAWGLLGGSPALFPALAASYMDQFHEKLCDFIQQCSSDLCTLRYLCYPLMKSLFKKQTKMSHVNSKGSTGWGRWRPLQGLDAGLGLLCLCGSETGLHAHAPTFSRSTAAPPPTGSRRLGSETTTLGSNTALPGSSCVMCTSPLPSQLKMSLIKL